MSTKINHAMRIHDYGNADVLKLEEVPLPEPQAGEVLVRVHAAGVNPMDWKLRSGLMKNFFPVQFPNIPGRDIAGVVAKVGPGVTAFQAGQAVFGQSRTGGYTEYTVAPVELLALKPESLSFEEAAAIPVGATTAWQALFDHGKLQAGQRVLILAAAGGVGQFSVQFASQKGAHVIGTASTGNLDYVRSLGAETVVDYTTTQIENVVHDVDLVVDNVGGAALATVWPVLKRGGTLVTIAGQPSEEKAREMDVRAERFSAQVSGKLLSTFAQLIDEGKLKIAIAQTFPLSEANKAQELSESGRGRGRIVLHIAD